MEPNAPVVPLTDLPSTELPASELPAPDLPLIVSVDDHVIEPATVWTDRLPARDHEVGPRIVRAPVKEMTFVGGNFTVVPG